MEKHNPNTMYGTTILSVRKGGKVVIIGDGQVTLGNAVMKSTAKKIRKLTDGSIIGGFAGATVWAVMRFGVARGLFSNESGLGSAAIAHAPAKTNEPVREGLVAMLGPFIDTIVICTMTALVIIISGKWDSGLDGATLSSASFTSTLPYAGRYIVSIGLAVFAFTTLIGWSYYGDRSTEFLIGQKAVIYYRII